MTLSFPQPSFQNRHAKMKAALLATVTVVLLAHTLLAQQFTPPALPAGAKTSGETVESEVLKVYALEDQGATYRSYAVKYKGSEVIVGDTMATSTKKVGDKIKFSVVRVELPVGGRKISTMSFSILPFDLPKKKP